MLFQQISRTDAEKVFGSFYAVSAMNAGQTAQLVGDSTADGNRMTNPLTNQLDLTIGIVAQAIAAGNPGLVQIYGFYIGQGTGASTNTGVAVYVATGVTGNIGDRLVPVANQTYLQYQTTGDGSSGHFCAIGTIASATATQIKMIYLFIRCM